MLEYPKLAWEILDAKKNSHIENITLFHLKINRKGVQGIFEKKTQGAKFIELKNLDPCIFLDFTKLV